MDSHLLTLDVMHESLETVICANVVSVPIVKELSTRWHRKVGIWKRKTSFVTHSRFSCSKWLELTWGLVSYVRNKLNQRVWTISFVITVMKCTIWDAWVWRRSFKARGTALTVGKSGSPWVKVIPHWMRTWCSWSILVHHLHWQRIEWIFC